MLEITMGLILHAGNAKSLVMQAIREAKKNNFEEVTSLLEEAQKELSLAHKMQTNLLIDEANENKIEFSLLLIHAQDHLMNAITIRDLGIELIDIYKR